MTGTRLFHTIRHLRRRQLIGQIGKRLRPLWENAERFFAKSSPEYPGCRWRFANDLLPPGANQNRAERLLEGEFTFLNQAEQLGAPLQWECLKLPMLWQYNLHYFNWLWALEFEQAAKLTRDWIQHYGLRKDRVGWDSYPLSLRLMNWCGLFFKKYQTETEKDGELVEDLWRSIFLQAEWLAQHLETHLLGNHLLENAGALTLTGSCFNGAAAEGWRQKGMEILREEVPEQILADGMHFERSPMYHQRATYLLLILFHTGEIELRELVREPLERMLQAMEKLGHPDRGIGLFNDSAFGIAHRPDELLDYARALSSLEIPDSATAHGHFALPEAGYYGWQDASGACLICDAGPIGPDYLPGHAHGDIFSFELSLNGCRVIVDSGVFDYIPGKMRDYCRSTKAHNTVEIGGEDQCEFWGAFRVARRGRPQEVAWAPTEDGFRLSGWHDGYQRLPGGPLHHRTFWWKGDEGLEVRDRVTSNGNAGSVVSRLHLHPECQIEEQDGNKAVIEFPEGRFEISFEGQGALAQEESVYCPEFGKKLPNVALAYSFSPGEKEMKFAIRLCH